MSSRLQVFGLLNDCSGHLWLVSKHWPCIPPTGAIEPLKKKCIEQYDSGNLGEICKIYLGSISPKHLMRFLCSFRRVS